MYFKLVFQLLLFQWLYNTVTNSYNYDCRLQLTYIAIPHTIHGSITYASLRLRASLPPQLSQVIQTTRFRFFGQVARTDKSLDITRALKVSIRGLPKDWRPRHTWLHTLDADLQSHNLGLNSARKYAQDQEHRKHLVETATLQLGACTWWWRWWWWWWWHCNV